MASTWQESTDQLVGTSSNVPTPRPRANSFRINWRKFGSSARSVLCIRTMNRAQQDSINWTMESSRDVLHTRSKSNLSSPSLGDSSVAPRNSTPRKLQRKHTEKASGNASVEEVAKTPTIRLPEHTPYTEAAASLNPNAPLIKERSAQHRRGDASPFCNQASFLHFEETTAEHQFLPTGDTIEAVIDAMFQLGDRSHASTPRPPTPTADSEKNTEEKGEGRVQMGVVEQRERRISAGLRWETKEEDARRAWEAMKRRVMYIEEHGALPDDHLEHDAPVWNYRDAVERALRESRARWRKGWAEEALRRSQAERQLGHGHDRQAREETNDASSKEEGEEMVDVTTTMPKKGRRHAGCWIREKDGVFVRLYAHRT